MRLTPVLRPAAAVVLVLMLAGCAASGGEPTPSLPDGAVYLGNLLPTDVEGVQLVASDIDEGVATLSGVWWTGGDRTTGERRSDYAELAVGDSATFGDVSLTLVGVSVDGSRDRNEDADGTDRSAAYVVVD